MADIIFALLVFVGDWLCMSFLNAPLTWSAVFAAALIISGLRFFSRSRPATPSRSGGRVWRRRLGVAARWAARLVVFTVYSVVLYFCVAFGLLLGWSTSPLVRILTVLGLLVWVVTFLRRKRPRIRLPLTIPLGLWLSACLLGWQREESFIRCDDYLRLRPPAVLLMATTTDVAGCRPGKVLSIGRYPRKMWESTDGKRILFTTQTGSGPAHPAGRLNGLVCETTTDGSSAPRCVGENYGKSHAIFDAAALGKLLVTAWGLKGPEGQPLSAVLTLPRDRPLVIEDEHYSEEFLGELFYVPRSHTLHTFSDQRDFIRSFRYPGFEPLSKTKCALSPGEVRYDAERDEGVICGGMIGAAIRGNPLSWRSFSAANPWSAKLFPMSWGCDWDPHARRVYSAIPNLGLMYVINYDTGRILRRDWIGLGLRTVAFDAQRHVVYLGNFLRGDVIAVDAATGETRHRWFAGRFVREVRLSRDGHSLLVSSNLGIVRITLSPG